MITLHDVGPIFPRLEGGETEEESSRCGAALQLAAPALQADAQVVRSAVENDGTALRFAVTSPPDPMDSPRAVGRSWRREKK